MSEELPTIGLVRLNTILRYIPVSASTWWEGCRTGRFPQPIKMSHRTTVWKAEDIHALIQEIGEGNFQKFGQDQDEVNS